MIFCDRCHRECTDDEPAKVGEETWCYSCRERRAIKGEGRVTP